MQFYALKSVSRSQELSILLLFKKKKKKFQETGYFPGKTRAISQLCREAGRIGNKRNSSGKTARVGRSVKEHWIL